ncbi:beta-ketoacyl-ACP synthase III [Jatrophihabitans sp.]|uniref:beta-ketoacyl-ACP synthase III n=1 Tax=Jatrophihabitans sp. TaxID=1932789 RepID=UPI002CCFB649|nr:beta-ketoacyl-ACP synthase III [Jatrophihabitans sp.]
MTPASVLRGIGSHLPARAVSNDELARQLDTSDEWIRSRTGIGQRFVVEPGECTSDLAVHAGRAALRHAGLFQVDAVVLATSTPDFSCPATAPAVAARLGLAGAAAFDVGAVCTGFVYALAVAHGLIAGSVARSVLVIGADCFSTITDPADRTTRAIFGDGAGAVVLTAGEQDEPGALLGFELGSDGSREELIQVPGGGSRQRCGALAADASPYFAMQGKAVFMQAVLGMAKSSQAVLDQLGWRPEQVDHLVAHQANLRILSATAEQLGLPPERLVCNIARVGNTVAASVPLALHDAERAGRIRPGERVLLTAFGGGLTWGAAALRWPELPLSPSDSPA